ncbi:hypothetical protein Vadar_006332 [Vaccinium darrowii]|uniref:Uncharacterized protein n=1 Tax=Vaccinium darrowii TaxID=229202 RepID=A0ACB7XX86_9ERIC|nr:hypothetical protein Vadar_006332 [Vaccinium darrowii]
MPIKNYPTDNKNSRTEYKGDGVPVDHGKRVMTMAEFKEWIMQFDKDKDGQISRDELREAIRATGAWFSSRKTKHGVKAADMNKNGAIDDSEMTALAGFAQKELRIQIIY